VRTRSFFVAGLVVALLIAGVASYYASTHPDGLEYVAEQAGFADTAEEHAGADGPLADYRVEGVEDERLSGGLAGVAGALVVLPLTAGLVYAVRRRPRPASSDPAAVEDADVDRRG
jgi:cobalt/nickel transport protein